MPTTIHRATHDKDNPYTRVTNRLARDTRLSFEARGLMLYLLSHNNTWIIRVSDLMKQGDVGRDKVRTLLRELAELGYISRPMQGTDGKFNWEIKVYENPFEPSPEKPSMVKSPSPENPPLRNNKDLDFIKKERVEEKKPAHAQNDNHNPSPTFQCKQDLQNPYDDFSDDPLKPMATELEETIMDICLYHPDAIMPHQWAEVQVVAKVLSKVRGFHISQLERFREFWTYFRPNYQLAIRPNYIREHWGSFVTWLANTGA